jgi:tight adherence protein B
MFQPLSGRRSAVGAVLTLLFLALGLASPASAAGSGSIDHVEPGKTTVRVLYSLPTLADGVDPDLGSASVMVNGQKVITTAQLASASSLKTGVRRTTVLAIDTSLSMRGRRFEEAKAAAKAFLGGVSPDVYVGIVTFAGNVTTVLKPTLDRRLSASVIDQLTLSKWTRLYDGVREAVTATGTDGQRSVLVLTDGKDTTHSPLDKVSASIKDADVHVDVVALDQGRTPPSSLQTLATAGGGALLSANDPKALTEVFAAQARILAKQLLVTAELPASLKNPEGTVTVAVDAGGETYTDSAFVTLRTQRAPATPTAAPEPPPAPLLAISSKLMFAGLGVAGLGVLALLLIAFGVFNGNGARSLEDRIGDYTAAGQAKSARGAAVATKIAAAAKPHSVAGSAIELAEKALAKNTGLAASVGARLEAAGMSLKPAEWLLMHAGIAIGAGLVGFLLASGGLLMTVVFLLAGLFLPWFYLGFKRSRRVKVFNSQLADTLQLMAGSLSAGLSFAQSLDTVVREGTEPVTSEFKRSLVEARLGVPIEDALEAVAARMQSEDFKWVVMAVRIQRDVGGNLSEVLGQVSTTIREREYLRRQVKALSAEGKFSAYVLAGLPVAVLGFLLMTRPQYLTPMIHSIIGWGMLGAGVASMSIGIFWMSRLVKMEV